jgi:hypothetical protein
VSAEKLRGFINGAEAINAAQLVFAGLPTTKLYNS